MADDEFAGPWIVLVLCFLVAIVEGVEIVSFGVAAPDLAPVLALNAGRIGILASAGVVGLIFGAFFGGRLADRAGRKRLLIISVLGSAFFALASASSFSFLPMLLARLLTGTCVGVTMPNIIALAAEAGSPRGQVSRVSIVTSGTPGGGVVIGLFAATPLVQGWQSTFLFAAATAALLLPFLITLLPPDLPQSGGAERRHRRASYAAVLFGARRWQTISLWVAGFANQLIVYLLLAWLPTLMRAAGASRKEAALAMALFNVGGVLGGLVFGPLMRRTRRWPVPVVSYAGIFVGLILLLVPGSAIGVRLIASLLVGTCAIGSQLLIFGFSAETYEMHERGTGVGTATAFGRVGSTVGPILAGAALGAGAGAATILSALLPLSLVAGAFCVYLARRPAGRS